MHYSPLRYPGGKGKIAKFMKDLISENHLLDGTYVEPFAGGSEIAFNLLFEEYVQNIILNDLDRSIYALWYSVLNNTQELCNLILETPLTISEWKKQKEVQRQKETADVLELGFSTFYLNRTNRSGIIDAGVIGGIEQAGKWKMDARYNKTELIRRIQKIASYKQRIQIYNLDAIEFIQQIVVSLPRNTLIYFDPPYYKKGQILYVNHYEPEDHCKLSAIISENTTHHWVLTYDNTPEIFGLYSSFRPLEYTLNYSAANNGHGSELMFFSQNCVIPENIRLNIPIKI